MSCFKLHTSPLFHFPICAVHFAPITLHSPVKYLSIANVKNFAHKNVSMFDRICRWTFSRFFLCTFQEAERIKMVFVASDLEEEEDSAFMGTFYGQKQRVHDESD